MMKNTITNRRLRYIIILIFVTIIICVLNLIQVKAFFIKNKNDKTVYIEKVDDQTKFTFWYIHSVSKTPIEEVLQINDESFKLIEVRYIDQGGAGMPEFAYGNEKFEKVGEKFIISNFDRVFEKIPITVQSVFKDTLIFDNNTLKLDELIGGNGTAVLSVQDISIIKFLYYKLICM